MDIDELRFAKKFLTLSDLNKNTYSKTIRNTENISSNNDSMIIFIYIPNSFTAFHNVSAFYNNNNKLILNEYSKFLKEFLVKFALN